MTEVGTKSISMELGQFLAVCTNCIATKKEYVRRL